MNVIYLFKAGIKWNTLYIILNAILRPLTLVLIAKIIGKIEFCKVAIVTVIIGLSTTIAEFGISQAIIKDKQPTKNQLDTIFWLNILFGFLLFLGIFTSARVISGFYNDSSLINLFRIASVLFFLRQIPLVVKALFQKQMSFNILSPVEIVEVTSYSIFSLFFAYLGLKAYSIFFAQIIGILCVIFLLFYKSNKSQLWLPSFHISISNVRKFYNFGLIVTSKSFLNYLGQNIDVIIIGKILGTEALGIYHFGKRLVQDPRKKITSIFSRVAFPAYSMLVKSTNNSFREFNNIYIKVTNTISIIGFLFISLLFSCAPFFIPYIFGTEWNNSILLIQIFALSGVFELLSDGFSSSALYAFNMPKKVFKVDLILTPIRILLIFASSHIGIEFVAIVVSITVAAKMIYLQYIVNTVTGLTMSIYFSSIKISIFAFVISNFILLLINIFLKTTDILALAYNFFGIFLVYTSIIYILDKSSLKILVSNIKSTFPRKEKGI